MSKQHYTTKKGISIVGLIILIALVPLIAGGLNFMINRDFAEAKPSKIYSSSVTAVIPTSTSTNAVATSTIAWATSSPKTNAIKTTSVKTVNQKPTVATTTPTSAQTVTFTDKGFSPAIVTVARGQSVTFINNSSGKMWVAANPFPSSSEYPDFNQKEGVANGESWTFTFDQAGTWFYHNHYSPATGAKIVVSWK